MLATHGFYGRLIGTLWATTEELEFVVEVYKARFFPNFVFEFVDGAGGINVFDATAVGADKVVAVLAGNEEGEVGGAFVKAEAADHSLIAKALKKSENSGFITLFGKVLTGAKVGQGHGPIVIGEAGQDCFESFRTT